MSLNMELGRQAHTRALVSQGELLSAYPSFWWAPHRASQGLEVEEETSGTEASPVSGSCFSLLLLLFSTSFLERSPLFTYVTFGPICRLQLLRGFPASGLSFPVHNSRNRNTHLFLLPQANEALSTFMPCFILFMTLNIYFLSVFRFEREVHKSRDTVCLVPGIVPTLWWIFVELRDWQIMNSQTTDKACGPCLARSATVRQPHVAHRAGCLRFICLNHHLD